MNVIKRNEKKEVLKLDKVREALKKCFYSQNNSISDILLDNIVNNLQICCVLQQLFISFDILIIHAIY